MAAMGDVTQLDWQKPYQSNVYDGVARDALRPLSINTRLGQSLRGEIHAALDSIAFAGALLRGRIDRVCGRDLLATAAFALTKPFDPDGTTGRTIASNFSRRVPPPRHVDTPALRTQRFTVGMPNPVKTLSAVQSGGTACKAALTASGSQVR
jgi:hypothetical protein